MGLCRQCQWVDVPRRRVGVSWLSDALTCSQASTLNAIESIASVGISHPCRRGHFAGHGNPVNFVRVLLQPILQTCRLFMLGYYEMFIYQFFILT